MNQVNLSAISDSAFDDVHRQNLTAVLNFIIAPSDGGHMPGAAEYDIWGYSCDAASHLIPLIRDELSQLEREAQARHGSAFAALEDAVRAALVEQMRSAGLQFMAGLAHETMSCYHQQDWVLLAMGMQAWPPFPLGYDVERGDLSLLDPVRARGQMWREVR